MHDGDAAVALFSADIQYVKVYTGTQQFAVGTPSVEQYGRV